MRFSRLRQTHPRLGKAAYDAWDLANPRIDTLRCPTCDMDFEQPLAVEWDEPDIDQLLFSTRSTILAPQRLPYLTCPVGHQWTVSSTTRQDGQPDRLSFGTYIGGGGWAMVA